MEIGKRIGNCLVGSAVVAGITVIGGALSPLVAIVALPIFALKAIPKWLDHRAFYNQTLTDGKRVKHGRIEGQDYTRWDGKPFITKDGPTRQERLHEAMGEYIHGRDDSNKSSSSTSRYKSPLPFPMKKRETGFKTQKDLEWLDKEFVRREKKDLLDADLKMVRAFAKALIPFIGVWLVIGSETGVGGASEFGCRACRMDGDDGQEAHWGWKTAIRHHQTALYEKLNGTA